MDNLYLTFTITILVTVGPIVGFAQYNDEKFEFTRVEPGNKLGITTKVIAHIHRPAKSTTERWTFNREFTSDAVVKALNATCSNDKLIDKKLKWANCEADEEGFTAELTYGRPQTKNKTFVYLSMIYKPYERKENGKTEICKLAIVEENPVYFLVETFSKVPSNNSFPRRPKESVDAVHIHQLGKFGKEFLSIYGDSIDQDGIYNFDVMDYYERDQLYECFLSIGISESVSVIEEKCPIYCLEPLTNSELMEELQNEDSENDIYIMNPNRASKDKSDSEIDSSSESVEETVEDIEYSDEKIKRLGKGDIHNEL